MVTPRDLVNAQLYESEDAVIADELRHLLRARPDLRIGMAIYRYEHEAMSLARAAALAGVSWSQMRAIIVERGVPLRLGPETLEEARAEVETLRSYDNEAGYPEDRFLESAARSMYGEGC